MFKTAFQMMEKRTALAQLRHTFLAREIFWNGVIELDGVGVVFTMVIREKLLEERILNRLCPSERHRTAIPNVCAFDNRKFGSFGL